MAFEPNYQSNVLIQVKAITAVNINSTGQVVIIFADGSTVGPMSLAAYAVYTPQPLVGVYQVISANGNVSYISSVTLAAQYMPYSG